MAFIDVTAAIQQHLTPLCIIIFQYCKIYLPLAHLPKRTRYFFCAFYQTQLRRQIPANLASCNPPKFKGRVAAQNLNMITGFFKYKSNSHTKNVPLQHSKESTLFTIKPDESKSCNKSIKSTSPATTSVATTHTSVPQGKATKNSYI